MRRGSANRGEHRRHGADPGTATALYHRVSTIDQDPEAARGDLRTAASARGLRVVLEVEETGSGARNDRPGLNELLDAVRRGKVRTVMVWKLSRFGRSTHDLVVNVRQLEDAGVRFISLAEGLDLKPHGDAVSKLVFNVLAGVAEFDRETIVHNTRVAMRRLREQGRQLGRRPLELPTVEQVVELRDVEGLSWSEIAEALCCSLGKARRRYAEKGNETSRRETA